MDKQRYEQSSTFSLSRDPAFRLHKLSNLLFLPPSSTLRETSIRPEGTRTGLDRTSTVTGKCYFSLLMSHPRRSLRRGARDGGVYDKYPDGSAEYHAPNGTVRHYIPYEYSDEDRSDGGYYSSESPEETDSEYDHRRERGEGPYYRGYHHMPDDRGAVCVPDSDSPSEGDTPGSESETETDDYSDRHVPEDFESGSTYDREDHHSYGDPYDDWDDYGDDDYGDYDGLFLLLFSPFPMFRVLISPPRFRWRLFRLLLLD
jgi:hypothetical protein